MAITLAAAASAQQTATDRWAIVLHGGAGIIERAAMDPKADAAYRASLAQATQGGGSSSTGGSSLDAVEAAIRILSVRSSMQGGARILLRTARMNWMRPSWTAQTSKPAP